MTRIFKPSLNPQPTPLCSAVGGPGGPEDGNGIGGGTPVDQKPKTDMEELMGTQTFKTFSPNIHPIPAAETIYTRKELGCSEDDTAIEYTETDYSFAQLFRFSINPETGLRRAVSVSAYAMPREISLFLRCSGHLDYVRQYIDEIIFCPYIMMTDQDGRNKIFIPDAAAYMEEEVGKKRKLFVSLTKPVRMNHKGDIVKWDIDLEPQEAEISPNIIEGAARLHTMTNVMLDKAPEERLELSFIRKYAIPIQISAIDTIMGVYKMKGLTDDPIYIRLKNFKRELAAELRQLEQG